MKIPDRDVEAIKDALDMIEKVNRLRFLYDMTSTCEEVKALIAVLPSYEQCRVVSDAMLQKLERAKKEG